MIKLGIIGIGAMGSHHLRISSTMPGITEIVISESNPEKLNFAKEKYNVKGYSNHIEMLEKEKPDAVIAAVPTKYHKDVVLKCLEHNTHVMVEKPITETIEDADEMVNLAKQKNKILTVGHVERFNPTVTKLKELIKNNQIGKPYLVKTSRIGPFPKRLYGSPGGVLIDLAVHDIDVIEYLIGDIKEVYSKLIVEEKQEIYAKILLDIENKVKGSCEISWISPKRLREIEIYGTKGMLKCSYDQQRIDFYENADFSEEKENIFQGGYVSVGKVTSFPVIKDEPLRLEIQNFVNSVLGKEEVLIKPEQARKVLRIALAILDSGEKNRTINI
ncbi:Gfo/Idh/MocA family oxidoreductase [Candidatus Woesearchaeota archaeon]|nr:Gfo/Idh/MocA family oxidoreductase [Candidatus Woesearchaeota archaeon]